MIKVLLVDDHTVVRTGISRLLEKESNLQVVGEADSGEEALALHGKLKPDVIIIDISMPGLSGLETIKRIKLKSPAIRFLVFSFHENPLYAERSIEAGALGYVTKASNQKILIKAITKVASDQHFLSPDISEKMALNNIIHGNSPLNALSSREFEVLIMVAKGDSPRNIAGKLYLSEKTISNIISKIKNKLGLRNTTDMVHFAFQHKLIVL